MKYRYTKETLQEVVQSSKSIAEVCRKLHIKAVGGNYRTLQAKFKAWGINTLHFTGSNWNKGLKMENPKSIPLTDIMVEQSKYQSYKLKLRLLIEGIKQHVCEKCFNREWLNEKIPLELHHKNGNSFDHRLENIELLCPNCHALTDNYRGKNKGLPKRKLLE